MVLPISSHQLHQTTLIDSSKIHNGVTIFPFFDRDGIIQKIMVIVPPSGVYYLNADSGKLRVDWLGRVRLTGNVSELPRMRSERMAGIERLWHFDPWWLLKEPQFANLSWVPAVKASNCGELFSGVLFDRRFKRIRAVTKLEDANDVQYFKSHLLPPDRKPLKRPACNVSQGIRWRTDWTAWAT